MKKSMKNRVAGAAAVLLAGSMAFFHDWMRQQFG